MTISGADLKAIASAVWETGGLIYDPAGPAGTTRTAAHVLTDTGRQVRAVAAAVAALTGQEDPAALAQAVLAGLDPQVIAQAVAGAVGPDIGQEVVAALSAQLAKP